jgi:hypothetical protein
MRRRMAKKLPSRQLRAKARRRYRKGARKPRRASPISLNSRLRILPLHPKMPSLRSLPKPLKRRPLNSIRHRLPTTKSRKPLRSSHLRPRTIPQALPRRHWRPRRATRRRQHPSSRRPSSPLSPQLCRPNLSLHRPSPPSRLSRRPPHRRDPGPLRGAWTTARPSRARRRLWPTSTLRSTLTSTWHGRVAQSTSVDRGGAYSGSL